MVKKSKEMKIYKEVFSPIDVNTYILTGDGSSCLVIDCGCYGKTEEKRLVDLLSSRSLSLFCCLTPTATLTIYSAMP